MSEQKVFNCAFYGSLRRPMYNWKRMIERFGKDSMQYLRTVNLYGYEMYSVNSSYPAILDSSKDHRIVVDLFRVTEPVYNAIRIMEIGAGYYEDFVEFETQEYVIFPYSLKLYEENLIPSGDWVKFVNEQNDDVILKALKSEN